MLRSTLICDRIAQKVAHSATFEYGPIVNVERSLGDAGSSLVSRKRDREGTGAEGCTLSQQLNPTILLDSEGSTISGLPGGLTALFLRICELEKVTLA